MTTASGAVRCEGRKHQRSPSCSSLSRLLAVALRRYQQGCEPIAVRIKFILNGEGLPQFRATTEIDHRIAIRWSIFVVARIFGSGARDRSHQILCGPMLCRRSPSTDFMRSMCRQRPLSSDLMRPHTLPEITLIRFDALHAVLIFSLVLLRLTTKSMCPENESLFSTWLHYQSEIDQRIAIWLHYQPEIDQHIATRLHYQPEIDQRIATWLHYQPEIDQRIATRLHYQPEIYQRIATWLHYQPEIDQRIATWLHYQPEIGQRIAPWLHYQPEIDFQLDVGRPDAEII